MYRHLLRYASPLLALALFVGAATAERAAPPITGLVTDTTGTPLANARVVLSGANRVATTSNDGRFAFRSLPAGRYHIDVSFPGYAPGHAEVVVPDAGTDVAVRVKLSPTPLALEGVIVTGAPGGSDPLTITQSTTQLSGKEFDRQIAATVAQTLSAEPGITTRYAGPAAAMPVIRGLTGERVLMLENGQRTGDLSGASSDHAVSVDPLSATRIEVVRGPASLLYGSSALGGVVNVIATDIPTNVPSHVEGYLAAQGVSVTPGGAATAEAILPLSPGFALATRGGFRNVGDVRVGGGNTLGGTSLINYHGDAGLGYVGERLIGGVSGNMYDFNYGIPAPVAEGANAAMGGTRIDGRRYEVHGRSQLTLTSALIPQIEANVSAQKYGHREIESSGTVGTTFKLNTQTADVRAKTELGFARGTIGLSGLGRQYRPTGAEALTPSATSTNGGAYFYEEIPIGSTSSHSELVPHIQVGGRYDFYRIRTDVTEKFGPAQTRDLKDFSGSVGLNVPLGEQVSVGGSVARAFRAPSVEELFSNGFHAAVGSFDIGNPGLKSETNAGAEGILRVQTTKINGQFSGYYNRINNFIGPTLLGDTTVETDAGPLLVPMSRYDQADATLRGVEGKVEAVMVTHVVASVRGDVVRGRYNSGDPLPFMPSGHVGSELRWDNGGMGAGVDVQRTFAQKNVARNEFAAPAYTLMGINASFSRSVGGRAHSITVRADNLLDQKYFEATSRIKEFAPNPGRNVTAVYRVLF